AEGLASVRVVGDWAFAPEWLAELQAEVERRLRARAEASPLDPGLSLAEVVPAAPWASAVVPHLALDRRDGKAFLPGSAATLGDRAAAAAELESRLAAAAPAAAKVEDPELARYLEREGRLVRLGEGFAVGAETFAIAREAVIAECGRAGEITLARLRDLLGVGRRDAQLLLERLDADGVTRRLGDRRVLRRRGNP
ncbi:MAG: SelB C-terminal domain-containing protein, partial [Gaiella sp.]